MPNYTNSIWTEDSETAPRYERLRHTLRVDVAVIGGGITGVTTALLLKRAGRQVALIEARRVGKGETGKTTAHLTQAQDLPYHRLIARFGEEGASLVAQSQRDAIERIALFIEELGIDCAFERLPGFLYSERAGDKDELASEAEACRRLGLPVTLIAQAPLPFPTVSAVRFEGQAQLQPREYLLSLAAAIPGDGCHVFEDSHVLEVEDGEPCRVLLADGEVRADQVVVAAHVPISNKLLLHTKLAAYRTYVVGALVDASPAPGLFWDTDDPYHYVRSHRLREGGHVLILGGADHKVGQEDDTTRPFARLEAWVRSRFGQAPIEYRWSGQIIEPADGLAYIGRNSLSDQLYVATGFAGQGMTSGTLAGVILSDQICGRPNRYAQLYDATRFKPLAAAREFIRENVDFPAHLVTDRLRRPHVALEQLPPGEGTVLGLDGRKLAVYRNHAGELSALSPVCTHLGCHVHWNTTEKSWDCPCHGSRFDPTGRVLNGPATVALEARPLPQPAEHEREAESRLPAPPPPGGERNG